MTTTEQAFIRELKALLDRYQITFIKDRVYYDGESEDPRLAIGDDSGMAYFSIEDMADLRGGWKR